MLGTNMPSVLGLNTDRSGTPFKMLFKIIALLFLQGAWSISEVKEGVISELGKDFGISQTEDAKPRAKRCTCYSYMDRECVYYCHLDIIWVNTPERTVPYGMSSYQAPQRIRREAAEESPRCVCVVAAADQQCSDFCQSRLARPSWRVRRSPGAG